MGRCTPDSMVWHLGYVLVYTNFLRIYAYNPVPTHAGLPSSPRLAINSPPIINGADITICWLPSNDRGGSDDFHYNIYRLEVGSGQFLKINTENIPPSVENQVVDNQNEPICYTLTGLEEQTSFTIVVVASNGAANDSDSFTDVSEVENCFIAFYVATGPGINVTGPPI